MEDKNQEQTKKIFGFKWTKTNTYDSDTFRNKAFEWLVDRYFGSAEARTAFLNKNKGKTILDAGCGSGFSSSILFDKYINDYSYTGVDISDEAANEAKNSFKERKLNGEFIVANIQDMKLQHKFDIIFSEGVIHHTSDPYITFKNLVSHLKDDGRIMFYVYKKKAPVREYTDDFIREKLSKLSNEEAWEALIPLTNLGKALGDLNIEVDIKDDIKLLEIPKGRYNVQRLLYYYFCKMYYDKDFSIDEMNHINFDWFMPKNCYRFTEEDIKKWLSDNNLVQERFIVEDSGITAVARRKKN